MNTQLRGESDENLVRKLADHWSQLLEVVQSMGTPEQRATAHERMRLIRNIELELDERNAVDVLRHGEMITQLKRHGERLWGFIMRLAQICVQHDVGTARPLLQSFREYMEAWGKRTVPDPTKVREELDRRVSERL